MMQQRLPAGEAVAVDLDRVDRGHASGGAGAQAHMLGGSAATVEGDRVLRLGYALRIAAGPRRAPVLVGRAVPRLASARDRMFALAPTRRDCLVLGGLVLALAVLTALVAAGSPDRASTSSRSIT